MLKTEPVSPSPSTTTTTTTPERLAGASSQGLVRAGATASPAPEPFAAPGGTQAAVPAPLVRLGLPKGRIQEGLFRLLGDAGVRIRMDSRGYRPEISLPRVDTKILKPQNILEMLHVGSRDIGFAGADWVRELRADVVELLDTELDPVRIVVAGPEDLDLTQTRSRPLLVASEYETLTKRWISERGLDATFVRSYGATEVFPPEDADLIVDNTATGSTLHANHLAIVDEVMTSTTRLFAHPRSLDCPEKRSFIEGFVVLLRSVLDARKRVLVEINADATVLDAIIAGLPSMREPTVSPLRGGTAFAIKVAVQRSELPTLIPLIKARGGTDIIVTTPSQIVP